jgi:hypothetical protein
MAQAVSHRPVTAEALVRARVSLRGIGHRQGENGAGSSRVLQFPLSTSFHRGSPFPYILWG